MLLVLARWIGSSNVERPGARVRHSGMRFRLVVACVAASVVGVTGCASRTSVPAAGSSGPVSRLASSPPVVSPPPSDTADPSPQPSPAPAVSSSAPGAPVPSVPVRLASGAHVFVVTEGVRGPLRVALHDVIDVELISTAHGPHGALVPWQTPTSLNPAVLTPGEPTGLPPCPAQATCAAFIAAVLSVGKLQAVGPSGLLCDDAGANCVAVAAIVYDISVTVARASEPATTAPIAPSTNPARTPPAPTSTPHPTIFLSSIPS